MLGFISPITTSLSIPTSVEEIFDQLIFLSPPAKLITLISLASHPGISQTNLPYHGKSFLKETLFSAVKSGATILLNGLRKSSDGLFCIKLFIFGFS